MNRQDSRLTPVSLTLACLAIGCGQDTVIQIPAPSSVTGAPEAKFKETRASAVEHVAGKALVVETVNGSIEVRAQERADVEIVSHLKATTEERLKAVTIVTSRSADGTRNVNAEWPDGKRIGSESCAFEILIPDVDGLTLRSSNGKQQAQGFTGTANLRTSNGSIELINHKGAMELKSSHGTVEARDVHGPVKANTSNGPIKVRLTSDSEAPVELVTSNGGITLNVGPAFAGKLDISTSNGGIDTSGLQNARLLTSERRNVKLQIGESMTQSRIKTSNGSINVKSC